MGHKMPIVPKDEKDLVIVRMNQNAVDKRALKG